MLTYTVFTFNPFAENTYIITNSSKEALILDPGCYYPEERQLLHDFFLKNQVKPVKLVNTHCHLDHVFGNKWVNETYHLELHLHPDEEVVLQHAPQAGVMWGAPVDNYTGPLHYLKDNEYLIFGEYIFKIILVPGHSPGSICLYCENEKVLLGGDVLFRLSIGRTDLPGGNHSALLRNIKEKIFTLPDDVVVLPGHGESTTIGFEKKNNPFLQND